jgi:chromosome partitioning protein
LRRIAFINEKGGTGKTTLAVNLAAWLAMKQKRRVLLCDLDTQGHAAKSLGLDVRGLHPTVFDLLVDQSVTLSSVLRPSGIANLDLLPSNKALAEFPERVGGAPDRTRRLFDRLRGLQDYEFLFIDSPPSMSLTTLNAMVAATEIVIPVALNYFSLDGCAEILETVGRVKHEQRSGLRVSMVVPTLYRRTKLADEILERLRARFPDQISETVLGYSVAIDEAQSHGQSIWEYAPRSRAAKLLEALGVELLRRGEVEEVRVVPGFPGASDQRDLPLA